MLFHPFSLRPNAFNRFGMVSELFFVCRTQGPLIEFAVKSQQGEFFIRKARDACGGIKKTWMDVFTGCKRIKEDEKGI